MVFSSYFFIFWFLPIFLLGYYLAPPRHRALGLTIASYLFYGWWRPEYCILLAGVTWASFYCGHRISQSDDPRSRKRWLVLSLVVTLGALGFFKYAEMLSVWADSIARLLLSTDGPAVPVFDIILPIGISFFTFQAISYTVDLYRGDAEEAPDLISYASYISMFPQLIAGPIVRYQWIAAELRERTHTPAKFFLGLQFFALGLAKKVLLADVFALAVPAAFGPEQPGFVAAWVGVLSYTLQIYFDFSGYSDMAVGLGLLIGFTFPQNFNSPYKSASITEFWRRWHMSLSSWLRDYLYIPLGGNRGSGVRTYVNLMLVMLLGGLWHGASIMFVLWGLWHGILLATERALGDRHPLRRMPKAVAMLCTTALVIFGWLLFRAENLSQAASILQAMFIPGAHAPLGQGLQQIDTVILVSIPLCMLVCWFSPNTWERTPRFTFAQALAYGSLLTISIAAVISTQASPFLYFQF